MQKQQLATFNALANGARASAQVPSYKQSLAKIVLQFSGSITKALIDEIVLKVGSRTVFGPVSGAQLDKLMKYRGQYDHANFLSIDLTERTLQNAYEREVGAIDIPHLGGDAIFVEVLNSAVSGTPALAGTVQYTGIQFHPAKDATAATVKDQQLIAKLLRYSIPTSGTRFTWQPNFKGAKIKRIHFVYTGTDWTGSADGNLYQVEARLNGVAVHDRVSCLANRFAQQEHKRVPQAKTYTIDFIEDDLLGKSLNTAGAKSLEFIGDMTAADTITAYVECLDLPGNL